MTMDIQNWLKNDFIAQCVNSFGIGSEPAEAQAYLLDQLMENISGRVLLETERMLPADKRAEFTALAEGNDSDAIVRFVTPYIADFQGFVKAEAQKEIEQTRAYMLEESEIAVTGGGQ